MLIDLFLKIVDCLFFCVNCCFYVKAIAGANFPAFQARRLPRAGAS